MHRHFRLPALAALFLSGAFSVWAADTPVKGGTLIYLEQQPHAISIHPPAAFIQTAAFSIRSPTS